MSDVDRTRRLERMLRHKRQDLHRALERELGSRIAEDALGSADEKIEIGDRSVAVLGQDVEIGRSERRRREIRQIDEALARLAEGSYGRCEDCDSEIGEERLEILPFATQCVPCRQRRELDERRLETTGRGFRAGFRDVRDLAAADSEDPEEE